MQEWLWLGVLVGLVLWTLLVERTAHLADRLAGAWVPRARRQGRWAGPTALLGSTSLLLVFALLLVAVPSVVGDVAVTMTYLPFAATTAPDRYLRHEWWRERLAAAGADVRVQRAIAWWAGPPSLVGLFAGLLTCMLGVRPG